MFDANELADMRTAQTAHMMDTGYRMVHSQTYDAYNEPVHTYTRSSVSTACGLEMKSGSETDKETMTLINYDAILRLPVNTVINYQDRFEVTKRYGETITALVYDVISPVQRGPSGIRVLLKRIET